MADEAQGSGDTGNPPASTAAIVGNGSSNGAATDLWSGLQSEDNRRTVDAKGWAGKGIDDVVTSYRELESKLGKAVVPPSGDAKPEEWKAFYSKLGVPEKPDAYEFKLPEGIPEDFPYDGLSSQKLKGWAHEAGLTPKQAQQVHDFVVRDAAGIVQAQAEAQAKAAEEAHGALVKAWGDPSSETYKRNLTLTDRALKQLGGSDLLSELKATGVLGPNGEVKAPKLAIALAKVGTELFAEDTLYGGPSTGPNPFAESSENLTEQGRLIRTNPDLARALIRNAGVDPREYGL